MSILISLKLMESSRFISYGKDHGHSETNEESGT